MGAVSERPKPDVGDSITYRDVGQARICIERAVSNAGDRQAGDRAGDGHITVGTVVSGDGDRAAIGRESELGLHHDGQRQQQGQQHFERRFHTIFWFPGESYTGSFSTFAILFSLWGCGKKNVQANHRQQARGLQTSAPSARSRKLRTLPPNTGAAVL